MQERQSPVVLLKVLQVSLMHLLSTNLKPGEQKLLLGMQTGLDIVVISYTW